MTIQTKLIRLAKEYKKLCAKQQTKPAKWFIIAEQYSLFSEDQLNSFGIRKGGNHH